MRLWASAAVSTPDLLHDRKDGAQQCCPVGEVVLEGDFRSGCEPGALCADIAVATECDGKVKIWRRWQEVSRREGSSFMPTAESRAARCKPAGSAGLDAVTAGQKEKTEIRPAPLLSWRLSRCAGV